ncbi:heme transporter HRG1 isoform X1 [Pipistrellus kuhlii]|uniref:heme transporter HRG1 isoform X1 n=1 Tax=Pipistrellus kuhlii TaxID=59472 RepID=UPI001E27149A|nr:heme transporter HRG1 isoform X1 [Pipistrellus kuhlii]
MAPSRRQLGLRAAYAGLSSVAGFSIFIVWTVVYSQPWTAAMGGLAGVLALWVLVTHVMYLQDYWRTWLKGLRGFFFVGVLFAAVSIATFCNFLVLAITRHQSLRYPRSQQDVSFPASVHITSPYLASAPLAPRHLPPRQRRGHGVTWAGLGVWAWRGF